MFEKAHAQRLSIPPIDTHTMQDGHTHYVPYELKVVVAQAEAIRGILWIRKCGSFHSRRRDNFFCWNIIEIGN